MKIYSWDDFCSQSPYRGYPVSMTLGVFDGVHLGHQQLIKELISNPSHIPVVFTFRVNPARIISSKTFTGNILTLDQKLERMQNLGVKGVVIIDFSHDFSKLTGIEFFSRILNRVELKKVVLGENHRMGNKGKTGAEEIKNFLEKDRVSIKIINSHHDQGNTVSSTRIRELLKTGDVKQASRLLGFEFSLDLKNVPFEKKESQIVVERKNCQQILPPEGEYRIIIKEDQEFIATKLFLDDRYIRWNQNSDIPAQNIIFSD